MCGGRDRPGADLDGNGNEQGHVMRQRLWAGLAVVALAGASTAWAEDVAIALGGPITGQYASFGEQLRRGAEAAIADINAKGGVLGHPLTLVIGDDACDPKQAVAVANQLVSRKVVMVDGHWCSSSAIPASAIYADAGVLMVSPGASNPLLTDGAAKKGWTNVFRTYGRDDAQGVYAGKYLAQHYAGHKVAIVDDKSAYGKGVADETRKAMNQAGLKEVLSESVTQGDKDFSALVSKLKQAGIDVIYYGGYHTEAALIIRQARDQGLQAQLVSDDALVTDEFWSIAGEAGAGTLMTFSPDPRSVPAAKEVVQRLEAKGINPEGYTLYSYAAVQVFAEGAEKAKSLAEDKISAALKDGSAYETVLGPLSFDAKGDVKNPQYIFYVWKGGKYEPVS